MSEKLILLRELGVKTLGFTPRRDEVLNTGALHLLVSWEGCSWVSECWRSQPDTMKSSAHAGGGPFYA